MMRRSIGTAGIALLALAMGCAGSSVKTFSKPLSDKRQYGKVKKVAIMPFDSVVEGAQASRVSLDLFVQEVLTRGTFEQVEEPRYVGELMKKLKLRNTENLDREIVRKIGEELRAQALILGNVLFFGPEEKADIARFTLQVNMLDVESGDILWSGNTDASASTTLGEVLGTTEGPSIQEVARQGIAQLARRFDQDFRSAREDEVERMLEAEQAKAEKAAEEQKAKETPADAEKGPPPGKQPPGTEEKAEEILLQVKPK